MELPPYLFAPYKPMPPRSQLLAGWSRGQFCLLVMIDGTPVHRVSMTPEEWKEVQHVASRDFEIEKGVVINDNHRQIL